MQLPSEKLAISLLGCGCLSLVPLGFFLLLSLPLILISQQASWFEQTTRTTSESLPEGLPDSPYVPVAAEAALSHGLSVRIFLKQINQESGFQPNVVSWAGAQGIAQIMPATAQSWGVDPFDPEAALHAAAEHMAWYLNKYGGDYAKALSAYNAGPGATDRAIAVGGDRWLNYVPTETQRYIQTILAP